MTTAAAACASDLLGAVEVAPGARYHFPAGLVGFPELREFALVPAGPDGAWWLQSLEAPGFAVVAVDPFPHFPDYAPDVPDAELAALGAEGGEAADLALLAVVTLGAGGAATANLRAPLVLDARARRGRQVVLPAERRTVREPLALG